MRVSVITVEKAHTEFESVSFRIFLDKNFVASYLSTLELS